MIGKRGAWLLGIVTAAAAAVRFFRLDHFSYGLDEIFQGYWMHGTWAFFWGALKFDAVHPPLDYLVGRVLETLHPADWARKIPDVLWGTLTVPLLAFLMRRRADWTTGIVCAVLLAAAPFHVRYSQEFRPYALSLFLLTAALLSLDRFLDRLSVMRLVLLFATCLATAYTLYFAGVVLAVGASAMVAEDVFSADPARRRRSRKFLLWSPVFCAALFVAYLPWWPVVLVAGRRPPMASPAPLGLARAGHTLSFFLFATEGDQPLGAAGWLYLALVVAGLAVALRRPRLRFLAAWSVGGLAVIEIIGQLHPHYDFVRRFLPAGMAFVPLAAVGLTSVHRRPAARSVAALALAGILLVDARSLSRYFRDGRADWRPLAARLKARPSEERVFTENQYAQLCTAFYVVGPEWLFDGGKSGRQIPNLDGEIVRLTWSWPPGTTAWLVLAGEPVHPELRTWAARFPSETYPTSEGAVLVRLDPALRDRALAGP